MPSSRRLAWLLCFLGVSATVAALFGRSGSWLGVDVGAAGAVLFTLTMGAAIALFAWRGEGVFPDEMSVAERRAWVGLVFIVIILLSFTRQLWSLSLPSVLPAHLDQLFSFHFIQRLFTAIVAWSVISYLIGRAADGLDADERDLDLRHRADRAGDWALTLIVIACVCVLASVPAAHLEWWLTPIVLANVLIGLLIVKAFVEHLVLTYAYRAGRA